MGTTTDEQAVVNAATREAQRAARSQVAKAVREGRLQRRSCEVCGSMRSAAHHPDYTKPLDVRWLCAKHHAEEHARIRKIGGEAAEYERNKRLSAIRHQEQVSIGPLVVHESGVVVPGIEQRRWHLDEGPVGKYCSRCGLEFRGHPRRKQCRRCSMGILPLRLKGFLTIHSDVLRLQEAIRALGYAAYPVEIESAYRRHSARYGFEWMPLSEWKSDEAAAVEIIQYFESGV